MPDLFAFTIFTIFVEIRVPKIMSFHFAFLFAIIASSFSTNCIFHKMTAIRKNRLVRWFLPNLRSKDGFNSQYILPFLPWNIILLKMFFNWDDKKMVIDGRWKS